MEEQNRTYELIYPFDENDLLFSDQIEKSLSCIKNLTSYSDCQYINDIITLFNICTSNLKLF